ncbi:MAG: S41 family peptidase [Pseudomonadota bacterium]
MNGRTMIALGLALALSPLFSFAEEILSAAEKAEVIEQIQASIEENYVFADRADALNQSLGERLEAGQFDAAHSGETFAEALTESLFELTNDKHFLVTYNPELIENRQARREQASQAEAGSEPEAAEPSIDWNLWYAEKENFGFEKVEILPGNIGYVKLTFFQPLAWMQATLDSTLDFVSHTDALIIDLTRNGGGYAPSDSYFGSFFLEPEPMLWMSSYDRRSDERSEEFTVKDVGAERYLGKPVYILVGPETFSLGEKFAYAMKHVGRARIVGQVTAGAAHAIDVVEVDDRFLFQVPVLRNIHPETGKDWEGVGVVPHVVVELDQALRAAHIEALDGLIEDAADKTRYHSRYQARLQDIRAQLAD